MSGNRSRKTSYIWHYCTVSDKKRSIASCNICHIKLSYKTTISNLKKHLSSKHPYVFLDENERTNNKSIELVNLGNFDINDPRVDYDGQVDDTNNISTSSDEETLGNRDILNKKTKPKRHHLTKDLFIKKETIPTDSINASIRQEPRSTKRRCPSECLQFLDTTDECDAYAKALSLQLHKLNNEQRFIAEKIISEVVFCGRFGNLSKETQLSNTNTSQIIVTPSDENSCQKQQEGLKYNKTIFVQSLNEGCAVSDNPINIKLPTLTNEI